MEYIQTLDFEKNIIANYDTSILNTESHKALKISCLIYSGFVHVHHISDDGTTVFIDKLNPNEESVIFSAVRIKAKRIFIRFIVSAPAYVRLQAFYT